MNPTIPLGRIAGVRIGANWSWVIIFALIVWTLEAEVFPDENPGLARATYVWMAVIAAFAFFASLLLHELGHAVAARRDGVEIEGITLFLFGGVAQFKGEFPSAGAEFRIAIAGPLVTLALGAGFVAVAVSVQLGSAADGIVAWLGYINFLLLVFNLLPALPLDGGRILRAALWARKRDFAAATRVATEVSRAFAFVLIAFGLLLFFTEGALSGAWFALIGWFLLQAAASEARYPLVREALANLRVRNLMVYDPVTAEAGETIGSFLARVPWAAHHSVYPVLDGERPVGALAFSDVRHIPREQWDERLVSDSAIPLEDLEMLDPDEPALKAFGALSAGGLHRGLVVRDGRLVGLLSISDFARVLQLDRRS